MVFAQDTLEIVNVIVDNLGNFQNCALVAKPCHRQCWGSYSYGNMVGFDVATHAKIGVDACNADNNYWHKCMQYSACMGHVDQVNLDIDLIIWLDITGTQALRELMEAGLLAAPLLASVTFFSAAAVNLYDLDKAVAIIKGHNST